MLIGFYFYLRCKPILNKSSEYFGDFPDVRYTTFDNDEDVAYSQKEQIQNRNNLNRNGVPKNLNALRANEESADEEVWSNI